MSLDRGREELTSSLWNKKDGNGMRYALIAATLSSISALTKPKERTWGVLLPMYIVCIWNQVLQFSPNHLQQHYCRKRSMKNKPSTELATFVFSLSAKSIQFITSGACRFLNPYFGPFLHKFLHLRISKRGTIFRPWFWLLRLWCLQFRPNSLGFRRCLHIAVFWIRNKRESPNSY